MTNWRALQAAGSKSQPKPLKPLARPGEVLPRFMMMGSWKADLSNDGKFEPGKGRSENSGKRAKKYIRFPPLGGWPGGSPEKNGAKSK